MAHVSAVEMARGTPGDWFNRRGETLARRAALVVVMGAILLSVWGTLGNPDCQDTDFGAYYRGAAAVRRGETPYRVDPRYGPTAVYVYAPAFAYCLVPLTYLDYLWAVRCWLVLNWLAVLACLFLSLRLVTGSEWYTHRWRLLWLAALPVSAYFWDNLHAGQAALLVIVCCLGWIACRRAGHPFVGGLLLSVAVGLKLYPILLTPWLVLRRDGRGCAGVATGLFGLFLLPALWVGGAGSLDLHLQWMRLTQETQSAGQTIRTGNQSLLAVLARLPVISDGHTVLAPERLAALCQWYPLLLGLVTAAVYGALMIVRARQPRNLPGAESRLRDNVAYAVLLVLMTLAGPRSWRCNFAALVFPCMLLAAGVCQRRPGGWRGLAALIVLTLLNVCRTEGIFWPDDPWALWPLAANHFLGALAIGVAVAMAPWSARTRRAQPALTTPAWAVTPAENVATLPRHRWKDISAPSAGVPASM
jgi:hypothetical protein